MKRRQGRPFWFVWIVPFVLAGFGLWIYQTKPDGPAHGNVTISKNVRMTEDQLFLCSYSAKTGNMDCDTVEEFLAKQGFDLDQKKKPSIDL